MSHGRHFQGDWPALPPYLLDPYISGGGSNMPFYGLAPVSPPVRSAHVPMARGTIVDPFWQAMAEPRMMIRGHRGGIGISPAGSPFSPSGVEISLLRPSLALMPPPALSRTQTPPEAGGGSKLTEAEQNRVLTRLRKEVYIPPAAALGSRLCLYYRDRFADAMAASAKSAEERGKRCAVCLEDFEAKEEVMLTPCDHMFHEDCIVPWVKTNGNCPVCRCSLFDDRRRPDVHGRA